MEGFERSREAYQKAKPLMPGGVSSPVRGYSSVGLDHGLYMEKGKGAYLYDLDGNEYIDYVMSWGPLLLGHSHPHVVERLKHMTELGTSFGTSHEMETKLAELVISRVPSIDVVRMVNSGTEATMSALRLARGFTGRSKILKMEGCYHGHGDSLLIKAGSGVATLGLPDSPGVPESIASNTLTVPYNDLDSLQLAFEKYGDDIAAVILEPVAGNMGVVPPQEGFLEGVQDITKTHGSLLIFDEVMTGFRVGFECAQGALGVTPDLTCLGKVIGGGLPVGAYGGRKDIMEYIAPDGPIYQAGTLSGNPLAMTAGFETLNQVTPKDYREFDRLGKRLADNLSEAAERNGIPHHINRACSMVGFFFTDQEVTNFDTARSSDLDMFAKYYRHMLQQGVHLAPSQFEGMFLSTVHTDDEIDQTVEAADRAFQQIKS
ncbi:glutamate-1-semialdehyde 2,1-aminomutase [Salsuginibacillus halophilus]|uniref:Glutamate-1-semialdehyde 2,1-aminomutase n=1 Tax=Salsuginibacillus halophilus TaxID=517424 RepID=A0A2P8HCM8_9BACI|nr:glutamate-1-semialdehyde 2,1-aminomutase [Salsuginibacillus halophilus]PSL43995.1 glutamate-1-semialdehyde 2,1-aminomutase [Salsuginibacillus halophilus]